MFYVYAHYRADDPAGLPFYIGKGKAERDIANKRNPIWKNIANKHGFIIKRLAENLTESEAWELEKSLIKKYGKISENTGCLSNIADGGEGASGVIHSDETKAKWSDAKKGKTWEEIFGAEKAAEIRQRRKLVGRKHSEETKKKLSEAKKGNKNPMYGKSPSPEHSRKLSEARKGKPSPIKGKRYSDEARQNYKQAAILRSKDLQWRNNISNALTGISRSEETKRKMSAAAKLREAKKRELNNQKRKNSNE